MTIKTLIEKTYICDICQSEVEDFARPEYRKPAIREIKKLERNEIIQHLDICQNCSERLLKYLEMIKREQRGWSK